MNEKYLPAHVPAPRVFSPQQTAYRDPPDGEGRTSAPVWS